MSAKLLSFNFLFFFLLEKNIKTYERYFLLVLFGWPGLYEMFVCLMLSHSFLLPLFSNARNSWGELMQGHLHILQSQQADKLCKSKYRESIFPVDMAQCYQHTRLVFCPSVYGTQL